MCPRVAVSPRAAAIARIGAVPRSMSPLRAAMVLLLSALALSPVRAEAAGRYAWSLRFRSITTPHFLIHYHQGEEAHALRLATLAEDVHTALVARLGPPPAHRTHVVLVDQDDEPNGWATPIPYPLIEVRLSPPEGASFLGNTDDWLRIVFTHEYAHVLHLGQSRGWAAVARALLGRTPLAYPNLTLPLWQIEGLATWEESRAGDGRVHAGDFRAVVSEAARTGRLEPLDRVNGGLVAWPDGDGWYAYGAFFHEYLAQRFGEDRLAELSRRTAGRAPYFGSGAFKRVYGDSLGTLWRAFEEERAAESAASTPGAVRRLTREAYLVSGPRFDRDGTIVYARQGPHDFPALMRVDAETGRVRRITSRYRGERTAVAGDALYFDQLEIDAAVAAKSDLYRWDRATGGVRRLTQGARLTDPDLSPDGRMLAAIRIGRGARQLVLLDRATLEAGQIVAPLAAVGGPGDIYAAPRFSPDGRLIAAERRIANGRSAIVVVEVATRRVTEIVTSARGRNVTPAWTPDGRSLVFASDRDGGPFALYRARLTADRSQAAGLERVPGPPGGAHSPDVEPGGRRVAYVGYSDRGFDVYVTDLEGVQPAVAGVSSSHAGAAAEQGDVGGSPGGGAASTHDRAAPQSRPYRPWSTLWPRTWLPVLETDDEQVRIGAATGGSDALGYHTWNLTTTWAAAVDGAVEPVVSRGRPDVTAFYLYDRWLPSFYAQYSDETTPFLAFRLTPAERPVSLRERSLDVGAMIPVRSVRVSQAFVTAWHRERATISGPRDNDRSDRGALRVGWALQSAKRYGYSISPEEGVSLGVSAEADRAAFGAERPAEFYRLDARAYVRLWPRHGVLALRASGAATTGEAGSARVLRLGGTDGDGAVLSFDEDATSLMRGFPYATFLGTRVALANVEYRFPIWYVERGVGTWPLFLQTVHAAGFVDAGHAWRASFRAADVKRAWGAEVSADLVVGYVLPLTWTAGIAWGRDGAGLVSDNRQIYGRLGLAF